MNFVPKERAEANINKLISEHRKRKMKEIEEMEKEYEKSIKSNRFYKTLVNH